MKIIIKVFAVNFSFSKAQFRKQRLLELFVRVVFRILSPDLVNKALKS